VAFQAAVELLKERGESHRFKSVYDACLEQKDLLPAQIHNEVKRIYELFTLKEISDKVGQLIVSSDIEWKGTVQVVYQPLEGLKKAIPDSRGDWYFSGEYPTSGGYKVLNNSYLKWYEGDNSRSY
jgi:amidophosphoribosyltransferase